MVFSLGSARIYVEPSSKNHGLVPSQRELDSFSQDYLCETLNTVNDLKTLPMQVILALLLTNKQIYHEALPYFYRTNAFDFDDLSTFIRFIQKVPDDRLQHLSQVSLSLDIRSSWERLQTYSGPSAIVQIETAMYTFSTVKSLRTLDIQVEESFWFEMPAWARKRLGRSSKYTKAGQLPGLKGLAVTARKAQLLEIRGDCPRIKEWLGSEVKGLRAKRLASARSISRPLKRGRGTK